MKKPQILDISFSPLARDARVLRQLSVVAQHGHVTTVGYGPATKWSDEHIEVPDSAASLPRTPAGVAALALRRFSQVDTGAPAARFTRAALADRCFDLVIANDARALPIALEVAQGAPVWVDLHEWAPEEQIEITSWRLLVAPWMDHICRAHLPRAAASTTVAAGIAELYEQRYGVHTELMRNAAPFASLTPSPVPSDGPIRLVHSGIAVPERNLDVLIGAVKRLGGTHSLDLYLAPAGDGGRHEHELRELAKDTPLVRFHDPVAPSDLPAVLNQHDVGAYWITQGTINTRFALPNKFFDFVQARLAIAIGPSLEMGRLVHEHGLGIVSDGLTVDDVADALASMTRGDIARYKAATHRAASELSFEHEAATASSIIERLLGKD